MLFVSFPQQAVAASAWIGFIYVTLVSQLTGFFAWYYGLALGGIARVSQTQLFQLFFTLAASVWLLGETIDGRILIYGTAVADRGCDRRARPDRPDGGPRIGNVI